MLRICILQGTIEGITIEGVNGEPESKRTKTLGRIDDGVEKC